jgi:hypothetical protein
MHFVEHPHLRPTGIPPPPTHKPLWQKLAERLERDGLLRCDLRRDRGHPALWPVGVV